MRAFLLYSIFFQFGILGLLDVLLNFYYTSLGNSPETIGLLQSIARLAGFITSIPIGLLTNRIGTQRMIVFSSVACGVALWLQFVPILPMLALSRFLFGLAFGAQQIANAPLMVSLVETRWRTHFFALHNFLTMSAMALGSFMGGFLPSWIANFSQSLANTPISPTGTEAYGIAIFIASLTGVLSVIPLWYLRQTDSLSTQLPSQADPLKKRKARPMPWGVLIWGALPMLSFGFSGGMSFPFYNLFWRNQFDLSDPSVGTILSIGWLGMAILPLLNGWLEHRFGRAWALRYAMLLSALCFMGLGWVNVLWLSVVLFIIAIALRNTMNPLFQPLMLDALPADLANMASSMMMVMWSIGWFGATALGGFIIEGLGFEWVMVFVAISVAITGILVPWIYPSADALRVWFHAIPDPVDNSSTI